MDDILNINRRIYNNRFVMTPVLHAGNNIKNFLLNEGKVKEVVNSLSSVGKPYQDLLDLIKESNINMVQRDPIMLTAKIKTDRSKLILTIPEIEGRVALPLNRSVQSLLLSNHSWLRYTGPRYNTLSKMSTRTRQVEVQVGEHVKTLSLKTLKALDIRYYQMPLVNKEMDNILERISLVFNNSELYEGLDMSDLRATYLSVKQYQKGIYSNSNFFMAELPEYTQIRDFILEASSHLHLTGLLLGDILKEHEDKYGAGFRIPSTMRERLFLLVLISLLYHA